MAVTTEIDVRYRDLDTLERVNNAVFSTYLEEARTSYIDEVFRTPVADYNFVIAHLEIDFARRITQGDDVSVTVRVSDIGTSSIPMQYEITVNGEPAATAETTLVFIDPDSQESTPVPDDVRTRIVEHEGL